VGQGQLDQLEQVARAPAALAAPEQAVAVDVGGGSLVAVGVTGDVEAGEADLVVADVVHVVGIEQGEQVVGVDLPDALDAMIKHRGGLLLQRVRSS
jgi:hypothetical protein